MGEVNLSKKKIIFRCKYPECKKEGEHKHFLELINEEDSSVELPFCFYHFYIVIGGHFKAKIDKKKKVGEEFEIIGPLRRVEIIEQVIGAREMVAKLKSDNKSL